MSRSGLFRAAGLLALLLGGSAGAQETPMSIFRSSADGPAQAIADAAVKEDAAFSAGLQAYLFGLPLVHLDNWRQKLIDAHPEIEANSLFAVHSLMTPGKNPGAAPQVDTLYSEGLLELSKGPALLAIPGDIDRYFSVSITDAYGNAVKYVTRREQEGRPGRFVITGPDYRGPVPPDAAQIRMPTNEGLVLLRLFVLSSSDIPTANRIQDLFSLRPMSGARQSAAAAFPKTSGVGELDYYNRVSALMLRNPQSLRSAATVGSFRMGGLLLPERTDWHALDPAYAKGLTRALQVGPRLVAWRIRHRGERVKGWNVDLTGADFGDDLLLRAAAVSFGLVVNPTSETIYLRAYNDASGAALDAGKRYKLSFDRNRLPPCDAFWSVTTYDASFDLVANDFGKYSVNSRDLRDLGSGDTLEVHISRHPSGKDISNWVPAPSAGPFGITLRCYEPRPQMLEADFLRSYLPSIVVDEAARRE